jgi:hypothetical protein
MKSSRKATKIHRKLLKSVRCLFENITNTFYWTIYLYSSIFIWCFYRFVALIFNFYITCKYLIMYVCVILGLTISIQLRQPEVLLMSDPALGPALLVRAELMLDYSRHAPGRESLNVAVSQLQVKYK